MKDPRHCPLDVNYTDTQRSDVFMQTYVLFLTPELGETQHVRIGTPQKRDYRCAVDAVGYWNIHVRSFRVLSTIVGIKIYYSQGMAIRNTHTKEGRYPRSIPGKGTLSSKGINSGGYRFELPLCGYEMHGSIR